MIWVKYLSDYLVKKKNKHKIPVITDEGHKGKPRSWSH